MRFYNQIVIFAFIALSVACSRKNEFKLGATTSANFPILFSSSISDSSNLNVSIDFQLRASAKGDTVLFCAFIQNHSSDTIKLNPSDLQIETSKNIRSDVRGFNLQKQNLPPNSRDTFYFKFTPINNLTLYNSIGYSGDMDSVYFLNLGFIYKKQKHIFSENKIKFHLNKIVYSKYTSTYAIENKIKLFKICKPDSLKTDQLEYHKRIASYGQKINLQNQVEVIESGMIANGVSIRLNFYYWDSCLYLKAHIINHSENVLIVLPDKMELKCNDSLIAAQKTTDTIINQKKEKYIAIVRGGRFEVELKYSCNFYNEFRIMNNWLVYNAINKNVIAEPIVFQTKTN